MAASTLLRGDFAPVDPAWLGSNTLVTLDVAAPGSTALGSARLEVAGRVGS